MISSLTENNEGVTETSRHPSVVAQSYETPHNPHNRLVALSQLRWSDTWNFSQCSFI
jgi:hypothetical protein